MKKVKLFIVFLLLIVASSCKKNQNLDKRVLSFAGFKKVVLKSTFEVFIIEDSLYRIEIEGDKHFIDKVNVSIENDTISISSAAKQKWLSPRKNKVKIYIYAHHLQQIEAKETCDIATVNAIQSSEFGIVLQSKANKANLQLDCGTFYYWNNFPCGGELRLSGNVNELKIWNFGLMVVQATSLQAQYALVENSSKGDCNITAYKQLECALKSSGNINVYGKPEKVIIKEESSTGKLILH